MEQLMECPWFQASHVTIQAELAQLPCEGRENHDGFLQDLANRPNTMGGLTVLELVKLAHGNFALIPIFKVRNEQGAEYTYEYVSWRYGPASGAKGIVFVRNGGVITHFLLLRGDKFATGSIEWDLVGGFIDLDVNGVKNALDRFAVEIREELGLPDLKIDDDIIDFGPQLIDSGMTNNRPTFFVAFIDGSEAVRLTETPFNPDEFELKARVVVIPISQLTEMVKKVPDGYFRSVVALCAVNGLVKLGA